MEPSQPWKIDSHQVYGHACLPRCLVHDAGIVAEDVNPTKGLHSLVQGSLKEQKKTTGWTTWPLWPPDPSCNSSMQVTSSNPVRHTNFSMPSGTQYVRRVFYVLCIQKNYQRLWLHKVTDLSWWETVSISTACYYTNWSSGLQWHNWKTNGHTTSPSTQQRKKRSLETTLIPSAKARATHLTDEEAQVAPVASSEGSPSPPTGAWMSQWRSLGWLFPSSVSILGYENSSPL